MISGCVSVGTTSASPPAPRTKPASHSAAALTSSPCAGSALTLGIATSSESSSCQVTAASLRGCELAAGCFDVPAARQPHGRRDPVPIQHRLERVDRTARRDDQKAGQGGGEG